MAADKSDAYFYRGKSYAVKQDHDKAIADFVEVVRLQPRNVQALICLADCWFQKRDLDQAIRYYTQAIAVEPNAYAFAWRSAAYVGKQDFEHGLADADEAIRLAPQMPDAHANRGQACLAMGNPREAIEDFAEAIRLAPRESRYYSFRGLAYSYIAEHDSALSDHEQAFRLLESCPCSGGSALPPEIAD